jgi:class 3 adenylate cyclase/tetratricopeptide (TPR) repeat protein
MPLQGSTPDVSTWLAELGLAQYASLFVENHVDAKLLPTLTDNDLRELGVTSFGHRKKMLQAIACLNAPPSEPPLSAPSPTTGPERRQLTVLFVDLVASTELATHLDPEDMSDILRLYQTIVADEVNRLGGYVAKLMGDGALAYFGWPQAHEDEAERAVRAALAMASRIGGLVTPIGTTMAARVGLATGMVVVGDIIGTGGAREETAVGEVLSLAARLQALAPPGGIVVSDATRRLLGDLFALTSLGEVELKGFPSKIHAWRVLEASARRGRFDARAGSQLPPMIGRDQELALLLQHWSEAMAGEGQAFVVLGEAGIGKSRLIRALRDEISGQPHCEIYLQCSPFYGDTPLWPVLQALGVMNAPLPSPTVEQPITGAAIGVGVDPPLIAPLLGMQPDENDVAPELSPEARRAQLFGVLVRYVLDLAKQEPLLLILEDVHWADPSTLEWARILADRLSTSAILLLMTGRPDISPALPGTSHVTHLTLGRLGRAAVAAMVTSRVSDRHLASSILETVISRTDGVPLFVEELSKDLIDHHSALTDHGSLIIPSSLHDTLMARLHRLPGHHDVAQIASCIGREFGYRMLAAIADLPEAQLRYGLEQLCEAELLFRHGSPPEASYSFKHALVRDAAYESLLKRRRRTIHARILAALENGVAPAAAEEIARHAAAAGLWQKAFQYFSVAGRAALGRAANAEGFALTAKALAAAEQIADDINARVNVIDLHQARGWAYLTIGDTAAVALELDAAETSAAQLGLERVTCRLRAQRAHVETIFGGTIRNAVRYGGDAARIAAKLGDQELSAVARFVLGLGFLFGGRYRSAVAELTVDAEAYVHGLRVAAVGSSGTLAVDGLAVLGDALGQLGRWDDAIRQGTAAQAVARETGIPWDMHVANYHLARTFLARGDPETALPLITWNIDFAERCGLPMVLNWHYALLGHACMLRGQHEEALQWLDRSISACTAMQLVWARTFGLVIKAEALISGGQKAAAEPAAVEALRLARRHGYRAFKAGAGSIIACCRGAPMRR